MRSLLEERYYKFIAGGQRPDPLHPARQALERHWPLRLVPRGVAPLLQRRGARGGSNPTYYRQRVGVEIQAGHQSRRRDAFKFGGVAVGAVVGPPPEHRAKDRWLFCLPRRHARGFVLLSFLAPWKRVVVCRGGNQS